MRICSLIYLSNHCHLLLRPRSVEQLASFMRDVNSKIAREVGRLHGWREKIWGRRYTDIVTSHEPEAQMARLRYLLEQGCKEGLVARPQVELDADLGHERLALQRAPAGLAAAELIEGQVAHRAAQVALQGPWVAQAAATAPDTHEGLLDDVVGRGAVPHDHIGDAVQGRPAGLPHTLQLVRGLGLPGRLLRTCHLRLGQLERAWQFRIKSSETLAHGSERLLYQRHADVIAVLYNSNFAMDRARKYLDRAGVIYNESDDPEMLEQNRELETQIY